MSYTSWKAPGPIASKMPHCKCSSLIVGTVLHCRVHCFVPSTRASFQATDFITVDMASYMACNSTMALQARRSPNNGHKYFIRLGCVIMSDLIIMRKNIIAMGHDHYQDTQALQHKI